MSKDKKRRPPHGPSVVYSGGSVRARDGLPASPSDYSNPTTENNDHWVPHVSEGSSWPESQPTAGPERVERPRLRRSRLRRPRATKRNIVGTIFAITVTVLILLFSFGLL